MYGSRTKRQTKARLFLNCEGVDLQPHELFGDIIMIGRAPANHIVIDHLTVSAHHAVLLRIGDCYWLKDLNSTNGTQINGVFVAEAELEDGDTIRFGSVIAFFAGDCCKRARTRIKKFFTNFRSNPEANTRSDLLTNGFYGSVLGYLPIPIQQ